MLRIALFGQAPLAADCLDRLVAEEHELAAVYAPPDGARPDPLAARAREHGLHVIQRRFFQKKSGEPIPAALDSYRELACDLNVLASMTSFLPSEIRDAPPHKSICFHPSLLPRYRGGNAMQWQIIEGESETGVSIFVPDKGVDTGPIVVQKGGVRIDPGDTTGSLFFKKLSPLGADALLEAVRAIDNATDQLRVQDESQASHQGLIDDAVAAVRVERPAEEIDRLVRGCDPQPGAFVRVRGEVVRLFAAELRSAADAPPATLCAIDENGVELALSGGALQIGRVRADKGKEPAAEWAARAGIRVGERVESG